MRRETAGVTESLLQAAKEEFLTYGFYDASMRRISAACGVSTNSIYTRFGDKSGLFTAIVQEAADGLMEMYMQSIQKATECPDMDHAIEEGNEGTDQVLAYIYRYKEEFQLLFCHSVGTEYEDYFDKLAAIEERKYLLQEGDGVFINSNLLHSARAVDGKPCSFFAIDFHYQFLHEDIHSRFGRKYL